MSGREVRSLRVVGAAQGAGHVFRVVFWREKIADLHEICQIRLRRLLRPTEGCLPRISDGPMSTSLRLEIAMLSAFLSAQVRGGVRRQQGGLSDLSSRRSQKFLRAVG